MEPVSAKRVATGLIDADARTAGDSEQRDDAVVGIKAVFDVIRRPG